MIVHKTELNFQNEKSTWFYRNIQHFYKFDDCGISGVKLKRNDRYHVFVHYPKLSENESEENFTQSNYKALLNGIEKWEIAIPGIFFHNAEYKTGIIFDEAENLIKRCPDCNVINSR